MEDGTERIAYGLEVGDESEIRLPFKDWKALFVAAATPGQHIGLMENSFPDGSTVYAKVIQLLADRMITVRVVHVLEPGVTDCHWWAPEQFIQKRRRVFVDGREVAGVWYVDERRGFVKTYYLDHKSLSSICNTRRPEDYPGREIEDVGGVLSETIYGKVELKPWEPKAES